MRRVFIVLPLLAVVLAASMTAAGLFTDTTWDGGPGNWATDTSWDTDASPVAGDRVFITSGTVQVTSTEVSHNTFVAEGAGLTAGLEVLAGGDLTTVALVAGNGAGASGTIEVSGGGQLRQSLGSGLQVGQNGGTGTMTVDGATSSVNWTGGSPNVGSTGTGDLTLTNGGTFTANSVTLAAGGAGTAEINVGNGGTAGVLAADVAAGAGSATLRFDHTNDITYGFDISGGVVFVKEGAGNLRLTGTNTYTGASTVSGGTLRGGAANVLGDGSAVTVAVGATLDLDSFNQAIGSLAGAGSVTLGTATLTAGGNDTSTTFSGTTSGTGALTKTGTGTLTLSGTTGHTGGTAINDGSLTVTTSSVSGAISDDGALTFNQAGNGTYTGLISGTGTLTKLGAGAVTLSANNSYTGTTTISAGSLLVNGSQPGSSISLTAGRLGGTGTVGAVTATGGTVAPGLSPGTLSSGDVAFGSATTFAVELDGAVSGTGYDVLDVTGTVDLSDATLDVDLGFTPPDGTEFVIIENDGADAITGTFDGLTEGATFDAGGQTFQITYAGGTSSNDVVLSAVGAPAVGPATLPALTVGEAFTVTFTGSGGIGPYTFTVSAGTLPAGLTLAAATGVLSGTPTTAGPYSFTITATDSIGGTDLQAYAGDVDPMPVPSLPFAGFLMLAGILGAVGYVRLRGGAAA